MLRKKDDYEQFKVINFTRLIYKQNESDLIIKNKGSKIGKENSFFNKFNKMEMNYYLVLMYEKYFIEFSFQANYSTIHSITIKKVSFLNILI